MAQVCVSWSSPVFAALIQPPHPYHHLKGGGGCPETTKRDPKKKRSFLGMLIFYNVYPINVYPKCHNPNPILDKQVEMNDQGDNSQEENRIRMEGRGFEAHHIPTLGKCLWKRMDYPEPFSPS